jgi:hypothetical protein
VRAKNAAGYKCADGSSTVWWSFITLALPVAFNKTSLTNAAIKQSSSPTLKWAASSGGALYPLQLFFAL